MVVTVEFIGAQRAVTKTSKTSLTVGENTTAGEVMKQVLSRYPDLPLEKDALLITVNHTPARPEVRIKDRDVVCLIPHIGGG